MNIRERHRAERWRRWREGVDDEQRETNPRTAGGRAWPSSPIDVFSSGTGRLPVQVHDPEVHGSRFTRVHTVTVEATSGQMLPDSGGPVQWAAAEGDPEGPLGFLTFRGATPTAVVTCDITGVLAVDLEWRWADQGSGDGRFRTVPKVTLRRNRQGTLVSRSWSDPQTGPGGDARHLGLTVQGRDTVELSLPHTAGSSKELGPARATFTLWETGSTQSVSAGLYALAEEDATGQDWLVTISTADGAVTKVAEWTSTDETPYFKSGMDVSGGAGWSQMSTPVADPTLRAVKFDLASAAVLLAVPPDGTSNPDWVDASPLGAAVGDGVLWTVATSETTCTAYRVDMGTGLDDGSVTLTPSGGNTVSTPWRSLFHDGTLYGSWVLDDNNDYLLGFDPSDGSETSRVGLSAVVPSGTVVGLARRNDGTWWLVNEQSATDFFLRQFDPDDGSEVGSVQVDVGWEVRGMAFQ